MMEFENFKNKYVSTVQFILLLRIGYEETKRCNEILHKFCENFIDDKYSDTNREGMKLELKIIKESLSKEIDSFYKG